MTMKTKIYSNPSAPIKKPTLRSPTRALIGAVIAGSVFATGIAVAGENMNRMDMTSKGHGLLYSGEARAQAGVPDDIADYIWGLQDTLQSTREDLHKIPELGFETPKTVAYITENLTKLGFEVKSVGDSGGLMVDIPGEDTSFTIGVRGDFDGLPFTEVDDGRPYRSTIEGQMHACGHDAHTTIVLGIAKAVADGKFKPPSNLRLILQPAEEIGQGAQKMVDAGVLKNVDVILGLHSDPTREWGRVGLATKNFSAFATGFTIEIDGLAAHAGMAPNEGKDTVMAGSYLVTQLQSIVARNLAPTDVGVVSVSMFNGGSALNQVADKAVLGGTTRAMSAELDQHIRGRMQTIINGASEAFEMPMTLDFVAEAPGVVQNEAMRDVIIKASQDLLGSDNVDITDAANMAGEDFSAYTQKIPGYFTWLGIANNKENINSGLHTVNFDIDPRALVVGVAAQIQNIKAVQAYHASGGKF